MNKTKYIPDTNITYDDLLELDNQLYKMKHEKKKLEKENKHLKDNWNKLKEWTKKAVDKYYDCDLRVDMVYKNVLEKMQELEKGDSNE